MSTYHGQYPVAVFTLGKMPAIAIDWNPPWLPPVVIVSPFHPGWLCAQRTARMSRSSMRVW